LIRGVAQFGKGSWKQIATLLPGRTARQCKQRWENTLNPGIKAGLWTAEEVSLPKNVIDFNDMNSIIKMITVKLNISN
jgi:hypothetical protein